MNGRNVVTLYLPGTAARGQPLRQLIKQRFRLTQIDRIEPLGEPAIDRAEHLALRQLALVSGPNRRAVMRGCDWSSSSIVKYGGRSLLPHLCRSMRKGLSWDEAGVPTAVLPLSYVDSSPGST